jgi:activating signal cointegrator complex subunit 2
LLSKYEWKGNQEESFSNFSDDEGSSEVSQQANHNQFRGKPRGRGGGRGGRGSRGSRGRGGTQFSHSSNAGVISTSDAYLPRHKGNHNRKNAHAKKMGKGFARLPE